ncbi:unnamed protein product [Pocillopora meandrina]|uniref:G-protein coupled receptors family 1 profile domain-containing protein n=1 Tax=Pocillopora meandrina TaxID=46732 RepID=A0AAU9WM04_9CNID|nr:unnamed protein product [Pocillopora meandrina]
MVLQDEDKNLTSVLNNNEPLYICDTAFLTALKPDALSTDVHSVLLFTTVMLLVFLPFTILLNILVIVAVNSTHELRTTSNILLACLATTDLLLALTIQPCFIAMEVYDINFTQFFGESFDLRSEEQASSTGICPPSVTTTNSTNRSNGNTSNLLQKHDSQATRRRNVRVTITT